MTFSRHRDPSVYEASEAAEWPRGHVALREQGLIRLLDVRFAWDQQATIAEQAGMYRSRVSEAMNGRNRRKLLAIFEALGYELEGPLYRLPVSAIAEAEGRYGYKLSHRLGRAPGPE